MKFRVSLFAIRYPEPPAHLDPLTVEICRSSFGAWAPGPQLADVGCPGRRMGSLDGKWAPAAGPDSCSISGIVYHGYWTLNTGHSAADAD